MQSMKSGIEWALFIGSAAAATAGKACGGETDGEQQSLCQCGAEGLVVENVDGDAGASVDGVRTWIAARSPPCACRKVVEE